MSILEYSTKEGISCKQLLDLIDKEAYSKKDLIRALDAKKSIDTLLEKLQEAGLIEKYKNGKNVFYRKIINEVESDIEYENKYKFLSDSFNNKQNNNPGTIYFRRKDNYAFKALYAKLKSMFKLIMAYDVDMENSPFYRNFIFEIESGIFKVQHIDVNRNIRAYYEIFEADESQKKLIKDSLKWN